MSPAAGRLLTAAARGQAIAAFRRLPIERTTVLYESFAGNGMLCNPEAIYRELRADPRYAHLRHVWVLDDPARHPDVLAELAGDDRVRVVTRRSAGYFRALGTAGFLVNNATFPAEFSKRPGQVYCNTWHGTPIKRMGFDVAGGAAAAGNIVRNFLHADVLLSASPFMTEQLYAQAYRLRNLFPGQVLEAGYPRMDRQFVPREQARAQLAARGVALGPGRVVLYAPTWRGTSFTDPRDDSAAVVARLEQLRARLAGEWTVLVKVHQAVFDAARGVPALRGALVDNDLPTNQVLAATDVLVADYSSVVVDFLALDRPIVLHAPDEDDYDRERGRYQPVAGWPGPVLADIGAVADAVAAVGTGGPEDPGRSHADARAAWRAALCPYEDGRATQRVVEAVFGAAIGVELGPGALTRPGGPAVGAAPGPSRVADLSTDGRPRVLLSLGELRTNGMTSSALNLLRALDHDRVDVTAMYAASDDPERAANIAAIDPRVRTLPRLGTGSESVLGAVVRQVVQRRGVARRARGLPLQGALGEEWRRCVGAARFDHVVDFIGYSPFWDLLLLQSRAPHRAVWLHNDMVADARREVDGRQPLRRSLEAVFSTYRFFDRLVSVSPALRDVNRRALAGYAPAERFVAAQNVIDAAGVLGRAAQPLPAAVPVAAPGVVTFVAVGRLSSAKAFPRLVAAFAEVHREQPATRLVIVGEGPDRATVDAAITAHGVADAVLLAGQLVNPFPVMSASDCFVMSSDHEGQPMVLLEALVLGLPVVTTEFGSVASALPAGQGLVVPRSVAGVAGGMRAFLRGEVPRPVFDAQAYNRTAVEQFLAAIGASGQPG